MTRRHHTAALGAAALIILLAGCSGGDSAAEPEPVEEETPHGYVEGAEEAAEPQLRLVVADTDTGRVRLLDLLTEEVTELGEVPGVDGVQGDGRFAYLSSSDEGTTEVFDSGVWTVDHGDHNHYYRTGSGHVGSLDLPGPAHVVTDTALTSLTTQGTSLLLERTELEEGSVTTAGPSLDEGTSAHPYQGALVTVDAEGTVGVLDRDGTPLASPDATCTDPDGAAVTRRGLVVGCAEGTLHVTEEDGELEAATLPHPGEERAGPLHHRSGSAVLAALPDDDTLWVLDLAVPEWRAHDQPGTVAATATGEEGPILALADDGTLRALDPETGEEEAATPLLDAVDPEHPPTLVADTSRAYVSDPGAGVVHEIDYADDLRVARTLEPGIAPHLMIQTGR
ncbi:ABC transporter [Nocardiopsis eucommiae]|uniref:ABC transporter n=1 Tax=Nocardiopsis eucommiae TaxID=2831970 RepID=UPI003D71DF0F